MLEFLLQIPTASHGEVAFIEFALANIIAEKSKLYRARALSWALIGFGSVHLVCAALLLAGYGK